MTLEAIGAVAAVGDLDAVAHVAPTQAPAEGFGAWFSREVGAVDASLHRADNDMRALATGNATSLHEVMIHLEEARLSFQLLAQVRNHILEAYQEVMRTQV